MNLVNMKNQAIQAQFSKEEQEKRLGFNFLSLTTNFTKDTKPYGFFYPTRSSRKGCRSARNAAGGI